MGLERELEVQYHWIIGYSIAIPSFCVNYPVYTIFLLGKRLRFPERIMMTIYGQEAPPKKILAAWGREIEMLDHAIEL